MTISRIYNTIRLLFIPLIPVYLIVYNILKIKSVLKKFKTPVICVGNLTTGGTGKTPAVIELAKILRDIGYQPGIVCRGYRGLLSKQGAVVCDGKNIFLSPAQSGDEPFLIAKSLKNIPVAIGSNRSNAIQTLINKFNINIIIMDDGFQNFSVYKDISAVIVDATNPFGNGLILPAGDLREPKSALNRSEFVIINKADLIQDDMLKELHSKIESISNNKKIFHAVYKNEFLYQMKNPGKYLKLSNIRNKRVLVFAGIANPGALINELKKYNPDNIKLINYSDHFVYNYQEIRRLINKSDNYDLMITTEKDYVKLADFEFNEKFYVKKISLSIKDTDKFKKFLKSLLKKL